MDTTSEASDTLWSPARLREHEYLTLATDLALLKCMENLSETIATRSKRLIADLDSLEKDTVSAVVQVENCVQNLNLISTKQFMEKRVYDDEDRTTKEVAPTTQVTTSKSSDIVPKIKEGILSGLPVIKSQFSVLQNGLSAYKSDVTLEGLGAYSCRPLPYIVGSSEFISSKAVGVASTFARQNSEKSEDKEVSYRNEKTPVPAVPSNFHILQITPNNQLTSDIESNSSDDSQVTPKIEEKEPHDIIRGLVDVRGELEARLKLPGCDQPSLVSTDGIGQAVAKEDHSPKSLVINPEFNQRVQPCTPAALAFTPPPIPKSKGLFDDSTSESDEESLFGGKRSTLPSSKTSSVKSATSSNHHDYTSERIASSPAQPNSKSIMASNNEVPNNTNQIPPVSTKPTQPSYSAPLSTEKNVRQASGSILDNRKRRNLFFSSDSDDDFLGEPVSKPQQPLQKQSESLIKSQVGYHASEKKDSNETHSQDIFDSGLSKVKDHTISDLPSGNAVTNQTVKPTSTLNKGKSLFSDSESDDDLFGIVQSKATSKPTTSLNKPEIIANSPYPNSKSTLGKTSENLNNQNGRNGFEGSKETARKALPSEGTPIIPDVGVPKHQPRADKLLVPNPTQQSVPQPSHAVISNKPSASDPNLSLSKVKNAPEQSSGAIPKKTVDPFPFKIPPPATGLFYSDDESDDELFKTSREPVAGLTKNFPDATHKVGSLRGTASSGGLPSSVDKNGLAANVVESPSSLVSDAVLTSQEPRHRLSEKSTGYDEIPEPILQSSSSNSKLKENREADAPSTSARLLYDSDEDLFNCRPKATAPLPSSMEPQIKSPLILSPGAIPSTVEKKTSTVPVNSGSGAKAVLKVKSYAANSLFDDSDDESLFGNSVKPIPSARTSTLLSDAPALDRPAEICHAKNEAPQVSETKYSENHDETRPVSNFSSLSHKPSLLSPDLSIKPFDVSPESGPFDADVASTADSQPATSETLNIEARRTQEPENLLSHAAQRTKDVGSELPAALNRSTSSFLQARTVSDILESSDDDDLFSPRDQSIIPSKPIAQERTSVPKTKDNLKEAAYHEGFLSEGGSDIKNRSLLSNQPTFIGNEPIGSDASNEEVSVEKNVTLGLYANTLESSDLVNIAARPNEITRPTKEEPPPVPVKSVLRPKVDESNSKSDDPHGSVPTEKAVPGFLSESSQSSELESAVQDTKVDRPSSNFSTTESRSSEKETPEKETSEVDGNHVAKVIEKTVENVRAGRIAALKLSLSQQPNALRFPSPGSQPGSSSDGDGTINNLFKKPFGGVPLFRPPITSSAKRRSPENTESNPSSPANSERSLLAKPAPDSVLEGAAKGVVESVTDTNPDSLGCVGRTRPRLPSSRRPPTRTFRRSRILENESEEDDDDKPMTNEKLEASVSSGKDDTSVMAIGSSVVEASELPIVKLPVATKGKLFSDSESSDDELFKPVPSIKKLLAVVPRTSIVSENLNQSGSFEEKSSSNPPKPPLGRSLPLSFLDDDSDDDLFAGPPKSRSKMAQVTPSIAKSHSLAPAQDPLSRMSE